MFAVSSFRTFAARIRPALGDGSQVLIASHVTRMALRVGSSLIVTRLLAPEAYGVIGIVNSIAYILGMVSDMGLRSYVIRHENGGDEAMQTVWTVRLIRNSILFAIMFFGAGIFADLYNSPEVTLAIRVCAFPFLLDGLCSLSINLTERNRGVIRLTAIDFAKFLTMMLTTIVAAYFLRTYWAIVIAMLVSSVFVLIASYTLLKGPPIRFRLDPEHVRDLWKFWRIIIPASMITILMTQANTVVMARYFPIAELGKFTIASTLAMAAGGLISEYVIRVFMPRFAAANRENPETAKDVYYDAKRNIVLLLAFGVGGLLGGGELLVRILYNDQYLGAGLYLSLLCLRLLGQLYGEPVQQAVVTKGFVRVALHANMIRLCWIMLAGFAAYILAGPLALVAALCLAELSAVPYLLWQLKRFGLLRLKEETFILGAAAAGAAIGFACYAGVEALIAAGIIPNF
ncbi:oligosaccharide flippase family protein [Hyphococcus luteus]|uniref:oligosaccharide flippase family protein n=1 Tax=Hyphococcus luteus TaxID=2058213 RepID=UPI0013FD799F|nr:oligosaccharide flippase family protein [Marinicaulis flavus]